MRKDKRIGFNPVQRVLVALACWYVDRMGRLLEKRFLRLIMDDPNQERMIKESGFTLIAFEHNKTLDWDHDPEEGDRAVQCEDPDPRWPEEDPCPLHGTDRAACERWQAQAQFPDWN